MRQTADEFATTSGEHRSEFDQRKQRHSEITHERMKWAQPPPVSSGGLTPQKWKARGESGGFSGAVTCRRGRGRGFGGIPCGRGWLWRSLPCEREWRMDTSVAANRSIHMRLYLCLRRFQGLWCSAMVDGDGFRPRDGFGWLAREGREGAWGGEEGLSWKSRFWMANVADSLTRFNPTWRAAWGLVGTYSLLVCAGAAMDALESEECIWR
jgi:hypothetical protein